MCRWCCRLSCPSSSYCRRRRWQYRRWRCCQRFLERQDSEDAIPARRHRSASRVDGGVVDLLNSVEVILDLDMSRVDKSSRGRPCCCCSEKAALWRGVLKIDEIDDELRRSARVRSTCRAECRGHGEQSRVPLPPSETVSVDHRPVTVWRQGPWRGAPAPRHVHAERRHRAELRTEEWRRWERSWRAGG